VSDEGPGFVPPEAEFGIEDDDLAEGGLGIAIIRALTDSLELVADGDGGSRLRFVKHLRP
jgi:anti-sigma regulatory factor (Ser/Thr protein kinase)